MNSAPPSVNWLADQAARNPDRTALVSDRASWTYAQLAREAQARAGALARAARPGDRVAFLAGNSASYALWLAAAQALGAVAVPLNARLSTSELAAQLDDCRPAAVLCDGEHLAAARDAAGPHLAEAARKPPVLSFDEALANAPASDRAPLPPRSCDADRVATVVYTSGSTGTPKGVVQTFGNHWHSARLCQRNLGFLPDDVWGCPTPLFHMSGLSILMRSLTRGVAMRVYDRFDAAALNNDLLSGRITCLSAVTYQIERLLDDLETRGVPSYPPSLRFVLQGGGPLPPATLERCRAAAMPVVQSFGMTETASQVVALSVATAPLKPGSSGRPLEGVQLRVAPQDSDSDEPVPPGTDGRILLKSPTLAVGYLNQPERFNASFTAGGWFDTHDIGHLDDDGYLYVGCRLADLIVSGGENVYPAEVEAVLVQHPGVAAAAVVGVADPVWGSVPVAVCVPAAHADAPLPSSEELHAFCRTRLAPYKCPRRAMWVDALPSTSSGKIKRSAVLEHVRSL